MKLNENIKKSFSDNGYFLFPNLISETIINQFLDELNNIKNRNSLYYSQSEHNWRLIKDDLDKNNLLNCSFENFTDLIWEKKLSNIGKKIIQSKEIDECLKLISKYNKFAIWQNMLFDKSTGTVDHLDSYYLDTDPLGELIACWIALEDIDGSGGEFHVYPKSHKSSDIEWSKMDHDNFVSWSLKRTSNLKKKSINIKKGDALFWHPLLFHGSSKQKVIGKSRKSLTAHYFPINFLKGGNGKNNDPKTDKYKKDLKKQFDHYRDLHLPIYSSRRHRDIYKFSIKGLIKYSISFLNKPFNKMNRTFYKEYK